MTRPTTDLCDEHAPILQVLAPGLRSFGGQPACSGPIRTVRAFEDNSMVRAAVGEPGAGAVLVVDGGGSLRCALLGDQLAASAATNGWAGVVVWGAVRDTAALAALPLAVFALSAHPLRSVKRGAGERDVTVRFGGVTFTPGHWLAADADGLIVAAGPLD